MRNMFLKINVNLVPISRELRVNGTPSRTEGKAHSQKCELAKEGALAALMIELNNIRAGNSVRNQTWIFGEKLLTISG